MDDFSKKNPKEPNFKAVKEHILGSLQGRNLAHPLRREGTFSIGRKEIFLNLKSFCNSWGNLYTKFAILDIKFPFTCGESDLY